MRLKLFLLVSLLSGCGTPRVFSRMETCFAEWSDRIYRCSDLEEIKDRDAVCLKRDEFARHEIECRGD